MENKELSQLPLVVKILDSRDLFVSIQGLGHHHKNAPQGALKMRVIHFTFGA